jgi:hypothetical protein
MRLAALERGRFVGEDRVGRILFSSYVVQPGTRRAFEEASVLGP